MRFNNLISHRVLSLSVIILTIALLTPTIMGATVSNHGDMHLKENDTNETGNAISVGTAPAEYLNTSELTAHTSYRDENMAIARGDLLAVRFATVGSNITQSEALPGANLVYATPGTTSVNTTHTATIEINQTVSNVQKVSLDYGKYLRPSIQRVLSSENIMQIGVDTDQDGLIEKQLDNNVEGIIAPNSKSIQFIFDGSVTVENNTYLILRYSGIQNPVFKQTSAMSATVTGNRTVTDGGSVAYGSEHSGLVGGQSNLTMRPTTTNETSLLTLRPAKIVNSKTTVTIFLSTAGYKNGSEYIVSTETGDNSVYILDRSAQVFTNFGRINDTVTISGFTTLAPDSTIGVYIYETQQSSSGIYQTTTVRDDSFWSTEMTLTNATTIEKNITVEVYDPSGTMIEKISI